MDPVESLNDPKVPSCGIALFTRKPGVLHKLGCIFQGALDRADLFSAVSRRHASVNRIHTFSN